MRTERELFNEWLKHYEECDVKIDQLQRVFMWQAWKASANRQGYKLVPEDQQVTIDDLRRAKAECIKFTNRVNELHDNIKL